MCLKARPHRENDTKKIEQLFLEIVEKSGRSAADLDLIIWRVYSSHRHLEPRLLRTFLGPYNNLIGGACSGAMCLSVLRPSGVDRKLLHTLSHCPWNFSRPTRAPILSGGLVAWYITRSPPHPAWWQQNCSMGKYRTLSLGILFFQPMNCILVMKSKAT